MSSKVPTDTCPMDFAVKVEKVSKTYEQWQRDRTAGSHAAARRGISELIKQMLKPEKKTIKALDDVSFTLRPGEFVAYAGPNGAGKSTTMKLLCGMLRPGEGEITVLGRSPQKDRVALMKQLGVLFGNRTELWWDHPVIQSFEWKKVVWDIPEDVYRENLAMLTDCLDLGGLLKTFTRELSLGQRMRADLALMLLHSPSLILLDEPTLGLDVIAKRRMINFLKQLNREKQITILVTSHDMDDLEEMADRILMIASGRLVYDGAFDGLRALTGHRNLVRVTAADGVYEHALAGTDTTIKEVLNIVSMIPEVRDIEIRKPPIEQVIEELYKRWHAEDTSQIVIKM